MNSDDRSGKIEKRRNSYKGPCFVSGWKSHSLTASPLQSVACAATGLELTPQHSHSGWSPLSDDPW